MALLMRYGKMSVWTVHINPRDKSPYANALFISEGFNFFAFLFSGVWALVNRLWWLAACMFLVHYGTLYLAKVAGFSLISITVIDLGIRFLLGLCANDGWRIALAKKGWVMSDIVVAHNMLEAAHRYYGRHLGEIEHQLQQPVVKKGLFSNRFTPASPAL